MNGSAYTHRLAVRFRDCDSMGHVNHAVYFTYLEQCRLTCWRNITGSPSPHTRVIIARAECDYRSPAHFGDELDITLRVGTIGASSFTLMYGVTHATTGATIATGSTVMVSYDYQAAKPVPLPVATRELLDRLRADGQALA
jgi:acyl-CoA thioester hydrolase